MYFNKLKYLTLSLLNDIPVGFALVRYLSKNYFSICEFFILRAFSRKGIATQFAHDISNLHPGQWHVAEIGANTPSQQF